MSLVRNFNYSSWKINKLNIIINFIFGFHNGRVSSDENSLVKMNHLAFEDGKRLRQLSVLRQSVGKDTTLV